MGAIVNGLTLHGFRAYGATFLIFSDYMKGADPPRGADGSAVDLRASRTTRSASARTAPPTSRSSSWWRCGRPPTCTWSAPPAPTRPRWRGGSRSHRTRARRRSRSAARVCRVGSRRGARRRGGPRRLRAARGPATPRRDPGRHRLRGPRVRGGGQRARGGGHGGPSREHAVHGAVRGAGPGLPRRGPAAVVPRAGMPSRPPVRWGGSGGPPRTGTSWA